MEVELRAALKILKPWVDYMTSTEPDDSAERYIAFRHPTTGETITAEQLDEVRATMAALGV